MTRDEFEDLKDELVLYAQKNRKSALEGDHEAMGLLLMMKFTFEDTGDDLSSDQRLKEFCNAAVDGVRGMTFVNRIVKH